MKDDLQQILEACLELLENGGCIEDCLKKYPADAEELQVLLKMAQLSRKSLDYSLPQDVGHRIYTRVMTRWDREHSPRDQKKPLLSLLPRWAYAAVSVVLFLIISGVGVTAAAANTLPGDSLYPIKRSVEEVRLAVALTDMAKAEVHVKLAEHRISEILKLAGEGELEYISNLSEEVTKNLEISGRYAQASKNNLKPFTDRLENSALVQLNKLELIRPDTSEDKRSVIDTTLKTSGEAYGKAIESASRNVPLLMEEELGKIRISISDLPSLQLDHMLVQIDELEIYKPGLDGKWITLVNEPIWVDVIDMINERKLIVENELDTGWYTQLRINVASITLIEGDKTIEAHVPDQQLNLFRPFKVLEGKSTELDLEIDWNNSNIISEEDRHIINLAVLLLAPSEEKPAGPPKDKPTGPPVDEPTTPPVDKPAGPPVDKPAGLPEDKPAGPPVDKPAGPPVDKPTAPPVDKPTAPPVDKPTGPLVDEPTAPPVDKPAGPPVDKPAGLPEDKPAGPPEDKPAGPPVDKLAAPPVDKPAGLPEDKPAAPPVDKPAAPPVDKPAGPHR